MKNYLFLAVTFTCDPLVLLVAVVFGISLMVLSRLWKQRVFSIFAVGIWVFIGTLIVDQTALLIVIIGLIVEELYYTFISKSGE